MTAAAIGKTQAVVITKPGRPRWLLSLTLWALWGVVGGCVVLGLLSTSLIDFAVVPLEARFHVQLVTRLRDDRPTIAPFGKHRCLPDGGVLVNTVDGIPTASPGGRRAIYENVVQGRPKVLTLMTRGDGHHLTICSLAATPSTWKTRDAVSGLRLYLYGPVRFAIEALKLLFLIGVAALLIRQCRKGSEPVLLALGLLGMSFNYTSIGALHTTLGWPAWMIVLGQVGWLAVIVALAGFPDARFSSPLARGVAWAGAALAGAFVLLTIVGLLPLGPPEVRRAMAVATAALNIAAVFAAFQRMQRATGTVERHQLRWAILGFAVAAVATAVLVLLRVLDLLQLDGRPTVWMLASIGEFLQFAAGPVGLLVALTRFRLFDADAVVSRSFVYGIIVAVLFGIVAAASRVVQVVGGAFLDRSLGTWASASLVALTAGLLAPGIKRLDVVARSLFQPQLSTLSAKLRDTLAELRWTTDVETIARVVVKRSRRAIKAQWGAMMVDGHIIAAEGDDPHAAGWEAAMADQSPLDEKISQTTSDTLPPLRVPLTADGIGAVGWLVFGTRPDGSLYGRDELRALEAIAQPVAHTVVFVRQRRDRFVDASPMLTAPTLP